MSNQMVVTQNRRLLKKLLVITVLMFGFAWGLIPLYQTICEVTGINQLVKPSTSSALEAKADDSQTITSRPITLRFDANVQPGLPWEVKPVQPVIEAKTGEFIKVNYLITNRSPHAVVGQAVPRYLPAAAGPYIKKLDCFCFKQQRFLANETKQLSVVFIVGSDLPSEIKDITLAYSVFDIPGAPTG